jgi:hypothetical protein
MVCELLNCGTIGRESARARLREPIDAVQEKIGRQVPCGGFYPERNCVTANGASRARSENLLAFRYLSGNSSDSSARNCQLGVPVG